jgi:hypothetical protein
MKAQPLAAAKSWAGGVRGSRQVPEMYLYLGSALPIPESAQLDRGIQMTGVTPIRLAQ